MTRYHALLLISLLIFASCGEESSNNSGTHSPDSTATTSPANSTEIPKVPFQFQIDPARHSLSDHDLLYTIQPKYSNSQLTEDTLFHCVRSRYEAAEIAGSHYFVLGGDLWCFAVIGNTLLGEECKVRDDIVPHVATGTADAALLKVVDAKWKVMDFKTEVGGFGEYGDWGSIGRLGQYGPQQIYMEILESYSNHGAISQKSSFVGVSEGKIYPLCNVTTMSNNWGMDPEMTPIECKCSQVSFQKGSSDGLYRLKIVHHDCTPLGASSPECGGPVLKQSKISATGQVYVIPEDMQLW